jgi:hypothetical protein
MMADEFTELGCKQKCVINYGNCLNEDYALEECSKNMGKCTYNCTVVYTDRNLTKKEIKSIESCQKDCANYPAKCLIQTFNPFKCGQNESCCALGCLKGLDRGDKVTKVYSHPHVASLKCSGCKIAAGLAEKAINKFGCGLADAAITTGCEVAFFGPEDPLADACAIAFIAACPTLAKWIENKTFTTEKACQLVKMC